MSNLIPRRPSSKPSSTPNPQDVIIANLRLLARRSHNEAKVAELSHLGSLGEMLTTIAELVAQTRDETLWLYTLATVARHRAEARALAALGQETPR